jgi:transcriptional regulator GlxA family with amidase domain
MCEPLVDTSRRAKVLHALLSTAVLEIEQLLDEQILPQDGVAQVASLIERFPGHPFSLDMLAQSVSMEPHLLIKRFKAAYGVTPMKHLRHIRLQKALSLLHSTTLPLGEIAKRVGWRSGFYLSAEMKRHFGRTPRDLRRIRGT